MAHQEDNEQITLFQWAEYQSGKFPELKMLYHIPNGGKRSKVEAGRFKAMGVKSGVPDIHLPVPRGLYHSLYIELKAPKGKVSENQADWLAGLNRYGNKAVVCYGWEQAALEIKNYLTQKESKGLYDN